MGPNVEAAPHPRTVVSPLRSVEAELAQVVVSTYTAAGSNQEIEPATEGGKVDVARIGRGPSDDQLWLLLV